MKNYVFIFLLISQVASAQNKNLDFKAFDENMTISESEKTLYFDRLDRINSFNIIKIRKNTAVVKQVKRYLGFN
ncbi:MAG: hypothetical protein WBB27_05525, partial [Maribacter sp.]